MSLVSLNASNFSLTGRQQTKTMTINVPGNVLVLFKMQGCKGCEATEPIFYQLTNMDRRVTYATVDLTANPTIVAMSRNSSTAIPSVPHIILYVQGRPHARYNGQKTPDAIRSFLSKALQAATQQGPPQSQQFMPQQQQSNMYGSTSASGPPQGQPQGPGGKYYSPEIGSSPSMQTVIKGGGKGTSYAYLGEGGEEDDTVLMMPDGVISYTAPWESVYKTVGEGP